MGEKEQNTSSEAYSFRLILSGGIAAYWAWLHLACFVPFGSFYTSSSTEAWGIMPVSGLIVTTVALLLGKRVFSLASYPAVCICATCISTLGTVLIVFDVATTVGVVMVTIIGPLCTFPLIGKASERQGASLDLPPCFYSAMVASFLIYMLGYALPWQAASILCILLPCISTILLFKAANTPATYSPVNGTYGQEMSLSSAVRAAHVPAASETRRRFPVPLMLALYTAVFSLALNFLMVEISPMGAASASPFELACIVQSFAIIAVAVGVELLFNRKGLSIIALVIAFLAISTLLTWTIQREPSASFVMPLLIAGYFLFVCVSMLKAAQYTAQSGTKTGASAIAACICANMLGLLAGSILGTQAVSSSAAFPSVLALAVCTLMTISLFLLPAKTTLSIASFVGIDASKIQRDSTQEEGAGGNHGPTEAQQPDESSLASMIHTQCEQVSQQFGLTPRETDILEYLLRGWELQSIAKKECLSRNTVKTHTSHIYRKLGAHSREECAMIVERFSENK